MNSSLLLLRCPRCDWMLPEEDRDSAVLVLVMSLLEDGRPVAECLGCGRAYSAPRAFGPELSVTKRRHNGRRSVAGESNGPAGKADR